jgi:hypothetical protein
MDTIPQPVTTNCCVPWLSPPFFVPTAHHHAYEAKDQDAFMRALNFSVIYNLCNYRPQANLRGIVKRIPSGNMRTEYNGLLGQA